MPSGKKLSDSEIKQRLIRLSNLEQLHAHDRAQITTLKAENKALKQQVVDLTARFEALFEKQQVRIEELETMVFGRKKWPRSGGGQTPPKQPRDAASYRRETPPASAITSEEHYAIESCRHCGGLLTNKEEHTRYVEDIILAALSPDSTTQFKTVEKHTIERGYCVSCGKYSSAKDLRGQVVSCGPAVRSLVCYLVTLRDHSYDQVVTILWDLYRFKLSDGEITAILDARRLQLLPEYENLKDSIRAGPAAHFDESRYRIQSEAGAGYVFSMSSAVNTDVAFTLADSRGKGHVEDLVGENYQGIGVTDRYAAYKHLFENKDSSRHQICWAHLQRNAKDLTHLECLPKMKQKHVTRFYQNLAAVYAAIRKYQDKPFELTVRQQQADDLLKQITILCQPSPLDPKRLTDLKAGILEYQDCLFICLTTDGIPADNNRAERDIRKLVIKRKKSLGVKTLKGARTLEVLLSVAWSYYNRDRDTFLQRFHALTTATQGE